MSQWMDVCFLGTSRFVCASPVRLTSLDVSSKPDADIVSWPFVFVFDTSFSGGGPIESRNCSSLALDITGDGNLWRMLLVLLS